MEPQSFVCTQRQAVRIASRGLCVFFLFWAACNLSEIPSFAAGMMHYRAGGDGALSNHFYTFWTTRYAGWIAGALLRAMVELWIALTFYRCSPAVARFLLGDHPESEGRGEVEVADAADKLGG